MKETHKRNWAVASKKLICLLIISMEVRTALSMNY